MEGVPEGFSYRGFKSSQNSDVFALFINSYYSRYKHHLSMVDYYKKDSNINNCSRRIFAHSETAKEYKNKLHSLEEKDNYIMKPLIDLTGRKLKLGDIIISGGTVSGMNRYLIDRVSKSGESLLRIYLSGTTHYKALMAKNNKPTTYCIRSQFNVIPEFIITDKSKLNEKEMDNYEFYLKHGGY